ncbi:DNA/RNA helicase domain-containing protein [Gordonia sp. 4N]|uniref:DNA/RNA helicase domain-containing protein n=1 Tax=Gordonia sp. 4N TaxID=2993508 RepID=UPI003A4D8B36
MSLYRASVAGVRGQIASSGLVETLTDQFAYEFGYQPSPGEVRSWERSLQVLVGDLEDAGLDKIEMLIEYRLPLTSKRADVVLCGEHPETGEPSYVVVELKQWTRASKSLGTESVVLLDGVLERLHPVEQVRRYCTHIADFIAALDGSTKQLAGVAYLHNASSGGVDELWDFEQTETGRLFTSDRRGQFVNFLKSRLSAANGAAAADQLMNSAVRPSKQLMKLAADEVQRREQFVLLDEQQVAYEDVMRAVRNASRASTKEVVIIKGGPGSGKSVIALSLLGELSRQGRTTLHATGSSAFTQTLRKVAGARQPRVQRLFTYYNQFIDAEPNGIDVLICDEAHRIRDTSTNRFTKALLRTGRPQVEELIDSARVPVFLLDEYQVVKPTERGSVAEIKGAASKMGCKVTEIDLDGQFRCGGSRAYEHWVHRLLQLEPGGPVKWEGDEAFEVHVDEAPSLVEMELRRLLEEGYSARIAAGYCWEWSDPVKGGGLVDDVVIGDWRRPWNNKKSTSHGGAPGTPYWAFDPAGFEQVGCVYTAQGFEYDYGAVIFGPDLVWRTDHWEARPEYSHDKQVKRGEGVSFDRAIRNTYKVLLTRGMRGMRIYSTDPETQALLQTLVYEEMSAR